MAKSPDPLLQLHKITGYSCLDFVPERRENNNLEMKSQRVVNHFLIFVHRNIDELPETRPTRPEVYSCILVELQQPCEHSA